MPWTLVPMTANFGRGVSADRFRANVLRVLDVDDRVVLGVQELDEADKPLEHQILNDAIDIRDTCVGWKTFEPIVVPWMLKVEKQAVTFACKGLAKYTPTRFIVEALISHPEHPEVPPVLVMNQHPPINRPACQSRRRRQRRIHKRRIRYWLRRGVTVVWVGDMNDAAYPKMHRREQTAVHAGLDYICWVESSRGAQVELKATGTVDMDIDRHNAHWARLKLTAPK